MALNRSDIEDIYPLSPLQEGMLFHALLSSDGTAYLEQTSLLLKGELHRPAFDAAWQRVLERHGALRATFVWEKVPRPLQVIHRQATLPVEHHDLRDLPAGEVDSRLAEFLDEDRRRSVDLSKAPLVRIAVLRHEERAQWMVLTFHHILLDGWSLPVLWDDFLAAYASELRGTPLALARPRPFREYVAWLARRDARAAEAFWRESFAGYAGPEAMAGDRRPVSGAVPTRHERIKDRCEPDVWDAVKAVARRLRVTPNTVIQAAWALVLSRLTGADDVVFGSTVSGRPPELDGVEKMVGMFINTIPVRVGVDAEARAGAWLQAVQGWQSEARQFEHSPLTDVHGWSGVPRDRPLFETLVVFENYPAEMEEEELLVIDETRGDERTNFPLTLVAKPGEEIRLEVTFDPDRFDEAAVRRIVRQLRTALVNLCADDDPRLGDVSLSDPAEAEELRARAGAPSGYPREATLPELFDAVAAESASAPALDFEDAALSYGELAERAGRLARHLAARGVRPGDRVAVAVERSAAMVTAFLAIVKAGAAYVPLDLAYPPARLAFMLADARCSAVVVADGLPEGIAGWSGPTVDLHRDAAEIAALPATAPDVPVFPESAANVIYTSGSTGTPKGTAVPHCAVVRLVRDTEYVRFRAADRVGQTSNASFDAATFEIWGALLNGAALVGAPPRLAADPVALVENLTGRGVTTLFLTPAVFNSVARERPAAFGSLTHLVLGGDALEPGTVRRVLDAGGPRRLVNGYGPTESTTFATWHLVSSVAEDARGIPIGRPIANTTAHVLDSAMRPVALGIPGELCLGGDGLAWGYLGRPGLTADRFVPSLTGNGERLYRTGDRVRWNEAGELEFLGRLDGQVKVRGFRIETGEIETALVDLPAIRDAVVVARAEPSGERRLVAYVVPGDGGTPGGAELREALLARLPEFMVPQIFVVLDALPLTPNGKVDRRALPAPEGARDLSSRYVAPRNPTEETIAAIWGEVLGVERVGVEDAFHELGGHSLVATRVVSRIREALGVELPLRAVFEHPTVAGLAAVLAGEEDARLAALLAEMDEMSDDDARALLAGDAAQST